MAASDAPSGSNGSTIDWAAALATHNRWLRTVVFARLGDFQSVDDVMQEVSLAAVEQRSPVTDPNKVSGWLYRLAVRHSLLFRRKHGRERRKIGRYAETAVESNGQSADADPLDWLLAGERQRLIRQALERLTRRERELLLLKYTENWSYQQLANHLGLSHSAVESRLHRARRHLRDELARVNVIEAKP